MNSTFVLHNGRLKRRTELLFPLEHRFLRFADGFFETMRAFAIHVPLFKMHYQRMLKTLDVLMLNKEHFPDEYTLLFDIQRLIKSNKHFGSSRVRITVYRKGEGLYATDSNDVEWFVETFSLEHTVFQLNNNGFHISVFETIPKPKSPFNSFKINHCTVNIIAANWAKNQQLDDALLVNEQNNLVEATSSNVFVVKNRVIYTPPIEDGAVDGIMRKFLLEGLLPKLMLKVSIQSFDKSFLLDADEIFLTNAVKGCQWVIAYKHRRYYNNTSKQIIHHLNEQLVYEHH